MEILQAGARIEISGNTSLIIRIDGGKPALGAAVIKGDGQIIFLEEQGGWKYQVDKEVKEREKIILYMLDDSEVGRVEDRFPVQIETDGKSFELGNRPEKHGAIILGEIYHRNGKNMMLIRGDGYQFGIKALCRKEGLPLEAFVSRQRTPDVQPFPSQTPFGRDRVRGSGSGVIVTHEHVITNAHVVAGCESFQISGPSGSGSGRLIAVDPHHDLALLHVHGLNGHPIAIRPAGELHLGEVIMAAGYPLRDVLGDDLKVTSGNISGLKGNEGDVTAFQFTAPIGSGSSGGGVLDQNGNLVGIVTASLSHERMRTIGAVSENMNFAVKSSLVIEMLAAHDLEIKKWDSTLRRDSVEAVRTIRKSIVSMLVG